MSLYTVVIDLAVEYCAVVVGSIIRNATCTIVDIGASGSQRYFKPRSIVYLESY